MWDFIFKAGVTLKLSKHLTFVRSLSGEEFQFYCLSLKVVQSDMLDPDPHGATLTSQLVKRGLGLVRREHQHTTPR